MDETNINRIGLAFLICLVFLGSTFFAGCTEDSDEGTGKTYQAMSISDIAGKSKDAFEDGAYVYIKGTVVSAITNYSTFYQFKIGDIDNGSKLLVLIPKNLINLSGVRLYSEDDMIYNLLAGTEVSILGSLTYYESTYGPQYSKWELMPTSLGKAKKISGRYCFEIEKEGSGFSVDMLFSNPEMYEGELVELQGVRVRESEPKVSIEDVGGGESLLIFTYDGVDGFSKGDIVNVVGEFTEYQGTWEIKLSLDYHYIMAV